MYELGFPAGDIANLLFGLIGIWMAHSLYRTTRKRWQAVLTWGGILLFCGVVATPLSQLLPGIPYVRVSMIVGFTGIFAYLYLFQDIPIQQRVFTYFMVDTSQTLLVLLSRTTAQYLGQLLAVDINVLFLVVYALVVVSFLLLFRLYLKGYILKALSAFRSHLTTLAVFAACGYLTLLLVVDAWAPWPALDIWGVLGWYALISFVVLGYALAFRTLISILEQETAKADAVRMGDQLALSEQYYETLVTRVEQSRMRDHDLRHHVSTLAVLCEEGRWEEVRRYVAGMGRELPVKSLRQYSENSAVNAILEYYAGQCEREGVSFRCQACIPRLKRVEPLHLCLIFGNGLQNALDAIQRLPDRGKAYLEVKAASSQGQIAISIANPYVGQLHRDGRGELVSTKTEPGHGLGLASIRETARRYGGWCGVQSGGGVFTLQVTLRDSV